MKKRLITWTIGCLLCSGCFAIGITDPGRVLAIELCSKESRKVIEAQQKAQFAMSTGHVWIEKEVSEIVDFQTQFNNYLDRFHDVLAISAEIYGLYYETSKTIENVKNLEETLSHSPSNALALAFSTRRNKVYQNLIANSIDIVMDINTICFDAAKLTEESKMRIVSGIRPKLRLFNKQLCTLNKVIRYSSWADVWMEIEGRAATYIPRTRKEIALQSIREWKLNARKNRID